MKDSILVGITELQTLVDPKQSLEERLRVTMRAALNHWLVTDEADQFKMAVAAVLLEANDEERKRINTELIILNALSAAISGVPVDFGRLVEEKNQVKAVGLKKLWDEVKSELK